MPKVSHARQHHDDVSLIGRRDYFVVSHAAARLNHTRRTGINHHV
jgi:hypothetical protein